jgi:hypothetical protein
MSCKVREKVREKIKKRAKREIRGEIRGGIKGAEGKRLASLVMLVMIISLGFLLGCFSLREAGRGSVRDHRIYFRVNINPIVAPRNLHAGYPHCGQGKAALIFSALTPHPSQTLASECTTVFQKAFLKRRVFKVTARFSAQDESEETLMALAREKGFDLLVQGRVTDFFLLRDQGHPGLRYPSRSMI